MKPTKNRENKNQPLASAEKSSFGSPHRPANKIYPTDPITSQVVLEEDEKFRKRINMFFLFLIPTVLTVLISAYCYYKYSTEPLNINPKEIYQSLLQFPALTGTTGVLFLRYVFVRIQKVMHSRFKILSIPMSIVMVFVAFLFINTFGMFKEAAYGFYDYFSHPHPKQQQTHSNQIVKYTHKNNHSIPHTVEKIGNNVEHVFVNVGHVFD